MTATDFATDLALAAATAASDKLASDIVLIDVSDRLAITDIFVIATGNSDRQVSAIVDAVEEALRLKGSKPLRREGHRDGRWVLLDYAEIVIHVQQAEERTFYALERLWKDCPQIPFDDGAPKTAAPISDDAVSDDAVSDDAVSDDAVSDDAGSDDAGSDEASDEL